MTRFCWQLFAQFILRLCHISIIAPHTLQLTIKYHCKKAYNQVTEYFHFCAQSRNCGRWKWFQALLREDLGGVGYDVLVRQRVFTEGDACIALQ
jgi:hypothetical protein